MSSFHVELLLASDDTCVGAKSYSECLAVALRLLAARQGRALRDPVGVSGVVTSAGTQAKKDALVVSVTESAMHATSAFQAELSDNTEEAIRQWNIVFNGRFPRP
jgi:hypothetical protein